MSITIRQALQKAYEQLNNANIKSARTDAEILLSFVLKKNKEFLYTYPEQIISSAKETLIKKLVQNRIKHFPIAYITNKKEFFGLEFYVNKNVLIPRPETEALVEETLKLVKTRLIASPHAKTNIAEIGTGSGCISVALAVKTLHATSLRHKRSLRIYATDICKKALNVATKNAKKHKVKSQITFLQGNLLEPVKNKKIDILIANLPYLDTDYKNLLKSSDQKALKHEPSKALYSGKDGLDHYHDFFEQVSQLKFKPKLILIEFGPKQTNSLKKIIFQFLPKAKISTLSNQPGAFRIE